MPMIPTLFSLRGLAVELGRDVRGLAKALATTPPDGKTGAKQVPAWRLTTALRAISSYDGMNGSASSNGSSGSRSNGGGSFDFGVDELEHVAAELRDALAALRTVKGIAQRRARATHVGPLLNRLHTALDRTAEMLPPDVRALSEPYGAKILGEFLAEIGSTLDFDYSQMTS